MMRDIDEFGVIRDFKFQDGKLGVITKQDVTETLKQCHYEREYGAVDKSMPMRKVASLPQAIVTMLKSERGIDVYNKDHMPALLRWIETEYKYFKTTNEVII